MSFYILISLDDNTLMTMASKGTDSTVFGRVNKLFILPVSQIVYVCTYDIIFRTQGMTSYVLGLKWVCKYAGSVNHPQMTTIRCSVHN